MREEISELYGTDGDHNYCRNPKNSEKTIWCYVGDLNNPTKSLCDPIGYKE